MIAAVVQVSKLVWKLKTLRLSHSPTIHIGHYSFSRFEGLCGCVFMSCLCFAMLRSVFIILPVVHHSLSRCSSFRSFFSLGLKRRSGFLTHSRPHSSVISLLRSAVHRSFSHIFIALLVALCISRPKEKWKYGHKDIINPGNHPPVFSLDATLH